MMCGCLIPGAFFLNICFCVFLMKIFGVHLSSIFCGFFYFLCTFFASSDRRRRYIRYRDNIGYPDMVKAIISGITNTPQKTYRIAQQILGIGHKP